MHYAELALQLPKHDGPTQVMMINSSSGTLHKLHKKPPAYNYFDEPTIYAQIDHYKTVVPVAASGLAPNNLSHPQQQQLQQSQHHHPQQQQQQNHQIFPPIISPVSIQTPQPPPPPPPASNTVYQKPFLREIVTIRTPLMFTQQESCV